jgi:perosamine synthetase
MSDVLAVEGGKPIVRTPIKRRNSVDLHQVHADDKFLTDIFHDRGGTLSGYLAGSKRGGGAVQRLEDIWCREFKVNYAVACNSGTSALLAACAAAGIRRGMIVTVPTMGMSAAAAAPRLLGADIDFTDVDEYFHLSPDDLPRGHAYIAINLFGRPCRMTELRKRCDLYNAVLIEDACQSLWASENGKHAGTIGHIGCYSMNVHKPLNAGEGGMLVTNDEHLAQRARAFINHGECGPQNLPGLNLRMPELTAILALSQIEPSKRIVERCREIHHKVTHNQGTPGIVSDHYCIPILAPTEKARDYIVLALNAEGVPCRAGYMLMHKLPAFDTNVTLPKAEDYERRMILIELCSIDPTDEQVEQMTEAIDTVWKSVW